MLIRFAGDCETTVAPGMAAGPAGWWWRGPSRRLHQLAGGFSSQGCCVSVAPE